MQVMLLESKQVGLESAIKVAYRIIVHSVFGRNEEYSCFRAALLLGRV